MTEYTKNYIILGEEIPLHIRIYNNGEGDKVIVKNDLLNFLLSCSLVEQTILDEKIICHFEGALSYNMKCNDINNLKEYFKHKSNKNKYLQNNNHAEMIILELPDDADNKMMLGIKEN